MKMTCYFSICMSLALLTACKPKAPATPPATKQDESEILTNRINIPAAVRRNLDISFVKAERRNVAKTLRVPGRFSHVATARVEYRAPVAGRMEVLVKQYDDVEKGQQLYRLDAPQWRQLQQEMASAQRAGGVVTTRLESAEALVASLRETEKVWQDRIARLTKLNTIGGGKASELSEAQAKLAETRAAIAQAREGRAQAEVETLEIRASGEQNIRFAKALKTASSWLGISEVELLKNAGTKEKPLARWQTMDALEVVAVRPGNVQGVAVATGGWVAEGDLIITALDYTELIFHATGLQSDLGRIKNGQRAMIVPPEGGTIALDDVIPARMELGQDADPDARTLQLLLYPERLSAWTRAGVAAYAEIVLDASEGEEPAIPASCVMTDGLEKVFFLRDPKDPDKVIRMVADLGVSDGRWVAVKSGVRAGDEVVSGGAYELKLSSSGKTAKGGHFHSDGTWHKDH